jgi:hypothetical protein
MPLAHDVLLALITAAALLLLATVAWVGASR